MVLSSTVFFAALGLPKLLEAAHSKLRFF